MKSKKIALLGIGRMGARMARRLIDAGYSVTVWNRTSAAAQALEGAGAIVATSADEAVRHANVVITILANGAVVEEVVFALGVDAAMPSGSVLIDMSSIPPDSAKDHAARLEGRGIDHIDAPVSGGTIGAEKGTLAIMGGGKEAVVERCRPILEVLGKVTYVGPHGSGQLTKLCNQVIVATTIGAVSEALLLASAGGALPEAVCEALQGGFADSRILREHGKRMLARDWRPGGSTEHQVKDLNAVKSLAESLQLNLPVMEQMRQLFQNFQDGGGGTHDHAALLLELERMNTPHRVNDAPDQFPRD